MTLTCLRSSKKSSVVGVKPARLEWWERRLEGKSRRSRAYRVVPVAVRNRDFISCPNANDSSFPSLPIKCHSQWEYAWDSMGADACEFKITTVLFCKHEKIFETMTQFSQALS